MLKSSLFWFCLTLLGIIALAAFGPAEKSLGANIRVVYLHGAWVWTALVGFIAAGIIGLLGLVLRRDNLNLWSLALGRTGLTFWLTYLPLSIWAMQTNWNGLFLAEPRFRLAVLFAFSGLLMQIGVAIVDRPAWASAANIMYIIILGINLRNTQNVMHPASPILTSDSWRIQAYFFGLLLLTLLLAWQTARWWYLLGRPRLNQITAPGLDF